MPETKINNLRTTSGGSSDVNTSHGSVRRSHMSRGNDSWRILLIGNIHVTDELQEFFERIVGKIIAQYKTKGNRTKTRTCG